jgi:hypothetical protein
MGYTPAWIGQIANRYNEQGPDAMHNRRHTTSWRAPRMLSAELLPSLCRDWRFAR